jgi:adenosylhomocysteine nucleosidase
MNAAHPGGIGLVVALEKEAACLAGRKLAPDMVIKLDDRFRIVLCGDGPERAARAADQLLDAGATGLISIGTAGALGPVLAPGDLVVPESVIRNGASRAVDPGWCAAVLARLSDVPGSVSGGVMLSADRAIARREDKAAAHRESGAIAVDMESAAVLERAAARGAGAIVLRVVLDGANTDVPEMILRNCDHYGRPRLGAMIAELIASPRRMVPFLRIAQGFAAASRTLRWLGRHRDRLLPPPEN